ncbi:hypothetical protein HNQ77_000898 [Silvibacterium bohemicum]|uniref:Uncharacterized protein n=1 Tax=Silvibacterium bohemicum TaxID=1577686 RepID=A0A841JYA7_9BACT|nr:hypothetical protein [Silvibacterium bohemicum]MBB6142954.1 hypothetical protein [Silvibacterium bohemicum]
MSISKCILQFFAAAALASSAGFSQSALSPNGGTGPGTPGSSIAAIVQPALQDVQSTAGALNTGRWKAPGEVRAATDRNLSSIQRDLVETLPGLIAQADGAAGSIAPSFAVYRNIDALYDVLLRVDQTAMLAAPDNEASAIASSLDRLESARKQLGDVIVSAAQAREAQIVKLQAAVKAAAAAIPAPPPAKAAVVDDGPVQPAVKKKRKPAAQKAPAPTPATTSGSASNPPSN